MVCAKLNAGYGAYYVTNGTGSAQIGPPGVAGPFGGLWQQIPGTIHLERFDMGGDGVAYNYPTGTNAGVNFRGESLNFTYNPGTGNASIGAWVSGEWIDYSVNVLATTNYSLVVPVASTNDGSAIHFELDGADVTGSLLIPTNPTGLNQLLPVKGVSLPSGHHTLRLVIDTIVAPSPSIRLRLM